MTSRADIAARPNGFRRLSYTCRCGWVDWGHALPGRPGAHDSTAGLYQQITSERANWPGLDRIDIKYRGFPAYVVVYGQSMGSARLGISVSTVRHWVVRKGLSVAQKERVALGIFMSTSRGFENLQSSWPYGWVTDSGYSAEDLVSNLIGFYTVFRGTSQDAMRQMCGQVSVEESYRIWDEHLPNGLGGIKNKTTRPIRFPCAECDRRDSFPAELEGMVAEPQGALFRAPARRFIDGGLVNAGYPLDMDDRGVIRIRQR
jgi:hypothetical protein